MEKINNNQFRFDKVSFAIWAISSLLGKTWRINLNIPEKLSDPRWIDGPARIFCFWHSQLLTISYVFRNTGKTAVVSPSRDGMRAAIVAKHWNHEIISGSSSQGGSAALRQCLKTLSKNKSIAITPDGPLGPREIVKPGVAQIAHISRAPVITLSTIPAHAWRLKSWDRFMIPKPFTKIKIIAGTPIVNTEQSDDAVEKLRIRIEERLLANGMA
jgi:lysophospholipid acyltransferase (LPLAT)-like uncharacterized protein